MDLNFSAEDEAFRAEVRDWLEKHLVGEFAEMRGRGGLGDMDAFVEGRKRWEQELAGNANPIQLLNPILSVSSLVSLNGA